MVGLPPFGLGSNLPSVRLEPYMAYNFVVEMGAIIVGGFTSVMGLESEIQVEEYREGGENHYVHQFPDRVTYPRLVLSHGLTDIDVLWNWYWLATEGRIVRQSGTIMLLDNQRLPVMWWNFRNAYPVKWVGPQFDASNTTQVGVEQLELVHEGLVKPIGSQVLSAVRAGEALAQTRMAPQRRVDLGAPNR